MIPPADATYHAIISAQMARIAALEDDLRAAEDALHALRSPTAPPAAQPPPPSPDAALTAAAGLINMASARPPSPARPHTSQTVSQTRYWTELEHNLFLAAVRLYGAKAYVAISAYVGSRTPKQVRSHSQKYQLRQAREGRKRPAWVGQAGAQAQAAKEHEKERQAPREDRVERQNVKCEKEDDQSSSSSQRRRGSGGSGGGGDKVFAPRKRWRRGGGSGIAA